MVCGPSRASRSALLPSLGQRRTARARPSAARSRPPASPRSGPSRTGSVCRPNPTIELPHSTGGAPVSLAHQLVDRDRVSSAALVGHRGEERCEHRRSWVGSYSARMPRAQYPRAPVPPDAGLWRHTSMIVHQLPRDRRSPRDCGSPPEVLRRLPPMRSAGRRTGVAVLAPRRAHRHKRARRLVRLRCRRAADRRSPRAVVAARSWSTEPRSATSWAAAGAGRRVPRAVIEEMASRAGRAVERARDGAAATDATHRPAPGCASRCSCALRRGRA